LYTVTGLSLEAVTARLPREILTEVERLAQKEKVDRSELIRRLLDFALQQKKIEEAIQAYQEGRVTLWKAAEMAGVSLRGMMEIAGEKKIPVSYTLADLKRDVDYVRRRTGGE
jgi:predicted HTH domain antitoxin